ncbi:MAG: TfoX/Sxy family protein [Planctomycetes bacterium]|nr:TfoX/Sxy family protein [Planctomycetota bacterium]
MASDNEFVDFVLEMLSRLGGVRAKAMFGGHGIYYEGIMVGLIVGDVFYLKVDDQNWPTFEKAGSRPFSYRRKNAKKPVQLSYWEVPPFLFDDRDQLCDWALRSHAAAIRSRQ